MTNERLASLDLLRSIAILLVLIAHIVLGFGAPASLAPLQLGGIGVDLFFVLSGWLLGGQLFSEAVHNDRINVLRFWYRRWMRTLPAYYAVLGALSLQQLLTKESWALPLDYLFFLQNYNQPLEIFHVSWSLAVEEQFYLVIAPAIGALWILPRKVRLAIVILVLVSPSLFRYLDLYTNTLQTHVRIDGCIAGVLLAYIRSQHTELWIRLCSFSTPLFMISSTFFALYFIQRYFPMEWLSDPGIFERALIFSSWLLFAVNNSRSLIWKVWGSKYIATRSYSLYLLHPIAIAIFNKVDYAFGFSVYMVSVFLLSLFMSEILYRTVELKFLRLRSRYRMFESETGSVKSDLKK
ncbi:acyltransferase [Marinobacter sp. chi1]|uniref:Acyltransferase n=1 Tax=Marinobacter suaedae TaxID=3057675 RepID=A0ABT8W2V8_9GAMM|nr:acyltransferase [Marinobacter sp. chi1]MDO3722579.1 acyltransferase [Marinobacter sp. chi1]